MTTETIPTWLEDTERISEEIIAPAAVGDQRHRGFPRRSRDHGNGESRSIGTRQRQGSGEGLGEGHRAAMQSSNASRANALQRPW